MLSKKNGGIYVNGHKRSRICEKYIKSNVICAKYTIKVIKICE